MILRIKHHPATSFVPADPRRARPLISVARDA
jgi:hypothetical protein